MKFFLNIKDPKLSKSGFLKKASKGVFALGLSLLLFSSCTDDLTVDSPTKKGSAFIEEGTDLSNMLMIPISLSSDMVYINTRDGESEESDLVNGTPREHAMDLDIEKECFAIFFDDDDKFMYIKRLYKHSQLGDGKELTGSDDIGEYKQYVVAYIDKPIGFDNAGISVDDNESDSNTTIASPSGAKSNSYTPEQLAMLPRKILVVINGGRIYSKLCAEFDINPDNGNPGTSIHTPNDFLYFQWKSDYSMEASGNKDGVIGINNQGHYTMTNSAYYGPDYDPENPDIIPNIEEQNYTLQTVCYINRNNIVDAMASNIVPDDDKCATYIFLERMVAKFSAPKFTTEVIGSNRVFRPSEDAPSLFIYSWDNNGLLRSDIKNWRIHVLGWTINGREKSNYLFKHIRQAWDGSTDKGAEGQYKDEGYLTSWSSSDWNDLDRRRSYWSIDPHYGNTTQEEVNYPWQKRFSADHRGISLELKNAEDVPLRYYSFDQINYWETNALTISENTFNPDVFVPYSSDHLDTRASFIAGPHLLVVAEIYLESDKPSDDDYIGQFSTVENLYGDRYFRYYKEEMDWFRVFVKEFDDVLMTQKSMTFENFYWGRNLPADYPQGTYTAQPTGHCGLFFDCELYDNENGVLSEEKMIAAGLTDKERKTYEFLWSHKETYHGKRVSSLIQQLIDDEIPVSTLANVKDGDGRLIPWIPGIVFRNQGDFETILPIKKGDTPVYQWDDNMRKSLIYKWFGAVDHYKEGHMYYAADIPHHWIDKANNKAYFGAVRNHWYTFTVTSINALGTPVDDDTQEIIPERYNYKDQMSVYLEMSPWHSVPSTSVTFK